MGMPTETDELKKLQAELELVKDVLGNLIAWLERELGQEATHKLMSRLYPDGF